ncbi:MAG: MFS transporter [Pseudomonadota bacterium]
MRRGRNLDAKDRQSVSEAIAQQRTETVSWPTVFAYGAPGVVMGYMYLLMSLYVMKFSTDVLLIAPAVMGVIFSISRIWDAVSDPLVGYLSDRTRSRLGRRRSWMLASIPVIGLSFLMVFAPPVTLGETGVIVWMAVAIIGFYGLASVLFVPHMSLGAEISINYHERSRLFGMRHMFYTFGSILALISMQIFISAEAAQASESDGHALLRATVFDHAAIAGIVLTIVVCLAVAGLRERPEFSGRAAGSPWQAYSDVWRNRHARLLIIVTFIENIGSAAIGALTLYVTQYVVGTPQLAPAIILAYMIPSTISVPMWLPLSRRFGKKRLWMFSMALTGLSFGGMVSLAFVDSQDARVWIIFVLAAFAGLAAGCGGTIGPSVQSDVIDFDEHETGERKEGSYFAAWNFVYKSAYGVMLLMTGFVLQLTGFVPNAEQTQLVKVAMVGLYGAMPLLCYGIGVLLFSRFRLDEAEHARIRAVLDSRAREP